MIHGAADFKLRANLQPQKRGERIVPILCFALGLPKSCRSAMRSLTTCLRVPWRPESFYVRPRNALNTLKSIAFYTRDDPSCMHIPSLQIGRSQKDGAMERTLPPETSDLSGMFLLVAQSAGRRVN